MNKTFSHSLLVFLGVSSLLKCYPLSAEEMNKKQPSMAFLEYLADQVEVDGKLIGPIDMKTTTTAISSAKTITTDKLSNNDAKNHSKTSANKELNSNTIPNAVQSNDEGKIDD